MWTKWTLGVAALVVGWTMTGEAKAGHPGRGPAHGFRGGVAVANFPGGVAVAGFPGGGFRGPVVAGFPGRPYHLTAGVRFNGGYYYPGHHHNHWAGRVWSPQFGRYHYWDPYTRCNYYWFAPRNCFLPVGCAHPF